MSARRWLLIGPVVGGALVAVSLAAAGPEVPEWLLRLNDSVVFAVATAGSLLAARAFSPGDYLRRAWWLLTVCYGLLLVDTLGFGVALPGHARDIGHAASLVSGVLTGLANVSMVSALIVVARAWRVAGLSFTVPTGVFVVAEGVVAVLAVVLMGPTVVHQTQLIAQGHVDAWHELASAMGDVVSMLVVTPLFLTALSLRGGALAWPWGLFTVSTVLWLAVDAADAFGTQWSVGPAVLLVGIETCRAVAGLLQFSAAWAQREAIRG